MNHQIIKKIGIYFNIYLVIWVNPGLEWTELTEEIEEYLETLDT